MQQRETSEESWMSEMAKHPRIGVLPSPDFLGRKLGLTDPDTTRTINDAFQFVDYAKAKKFLNTGFFDFSYLQDEPTRFNAVLRSAMFDIYAASRNTNQPELPEITLYYYAGHGISPDDPRTNTSYSTVPFLKDTDYSYFKPENYFHAFEDRLKGGELYLHHCGFAGLWGLMMPWIASVTSVSINSKGVKKNKIGIFLLDSCYSGIFCDELKQLNEKKGPWNQNGCGVIIQSSCGSKENAYGGTFTPIWLHFQMNAKHLKTLSHRFDKLTADEKSTYNNLPLQSPQLAATIDTSTAQRSNFLVLSQQNTDIYLFSNAVFFKFCAMNLIFKQLAPRAFRDKADVYAKFLSEIANFAVVDFKLKTIANGTRLGLFVLEKTNSNSAVSVHIHFEGNNNPQSPTYNLVSRINCVEQIVSREILGGVEALIWIDDITGLRPQQINDSDHKIRFQYQVCMVSVDNT